MPVPESNPQVSYNSPQCHTNLRYAGIKFLWWRSASEGPMLGRYYRPLRFIAPLSVKTPVYEMLINLWSVTKVAAVWYGRLAAVSNGAPRAAEREFIRWFD